MTTVYVAGRRHQLAAASMIAEGGEAEIYDLGSGTVLKLYRRPDDPLYTGQPTGRSAAAYRLKQYESKLSQFPKGLPAQVVTPLELAYTSSDARTRRLAGYTMRSLANASVLLWYSDKDWRTQGGVDGNHTVAVFRRLHELVTGVHHAQVVIGDFNDLNILVDATGQPFLVDADSLQYGSWRCGTYTHRFLDPLLATADRLELARPYVPDADWYAYTTMLFQSLLFVGPYGGVHWPKAGRRLQFEDRVLRRLTVFSPEVRYPKNLPPLGILPDDLLEHFRQVYQQDHRGAFPMPLLERLRWTTCTGCGTMHARAKCPSCALPGAVRETVVVRGQVTATRVFQTSGRILFAAHQTGKLRYLYHESGAFRRETGRVVVEGGLDPELRFRLSGDTTLLGRRDRLLVFAPDAPVEQLSTGTVGPLSVFDANSSTHFWLTSGQLVRHGRLGSEYIGDVLTGRTLFWTGERLGFGFYQAGALVRAFVFDPAAHGLNDQVAIPGLSGTLIDATCVLSDRLAWFMVKSQDNGVLVHRCFVVNAAGQFLAQAEAPAGDGSWLGGGIRGRFAVGDLLYAATDEGIVCIGVDGSALAIRQSFPDTEPFVDATTQLFPGDGGIYAVGSRDITLLRIK